MTAPIACIGGATLDRRVEPLGRLRSGTSNPVRSAVSAGGTARNIAEALARLGCAVTFCSRVGLDAAGDALESELAGLGIDVAGIDRDPSRPTASYTAVLDEGGELAMGLADMEILDALDAAWVDARAKLLAEHPLWIVDANLPGPALERLVEIMASETRLWADPVSVDKSARLTPILSRVEAIFPDRAEATALAGLDKTASPDALGARLRELGCGRAVITLGAEGVQVDDPPRREKLPAMKVERIASVNGAGDTFIAGYAWAELERAAGHGEIDPLRAGLAAASLSVESSSAVPESLNADALTRRMKERA